MTDNTLDELKARATALEAEIEAKHAEVDAVWDEIRRLTSPTPVVTHAATGIVVSPEMDKLRARVAALTADLAAAEAVCEMVEAFWRGETTSELSDAVAAWRARRAERETR